MKDREMNTFWIIAIIVIVCMIIYLGLDYRDYTANLKKYRLDMLDKYIEYYKISVAILHTEFKNKFRDKDWDILTDVPADEELNQCSSLKHLINTREKISKLMTELDMKEYYHEKILYKNLRWDALNYSIEEIILIIDQTFKK